MPELRGDLSVVKAYSFKGGSTVFEQLEDVVSNRLSSPPPLCSCSQVPTGSGPGIEEGTHFFYSMFFNVAVNSGDRTLPASWAPLVVALFSCFFVLGTPNVPSGLKLI